MPITLAQVAEARANIAGVALRTPLVRCFADSPAEVWLKLENLHPIGSFKIRGAANVMARLDPQLLRRGVLTASAGNMAQGVAFCARRIGVPAEAVSTPRRRSWGPSRAMALAAPRILNEPIGWRFSNFSQTSAGDSAKQRTSGVRRATPTMLVRASATWARVIGISLLSTKEGKGRGTIERFAT